MPSCSLQSARRRTITTVLLFTFAIIDRALRDILELYAIAQSQSGRMSCITMSPAWSIFLDSSNGVICQGPCSIPGFLQQRLELALELRTKGHFRSPRPAENRMALWTSGDPELGFAEELGGCTYQGP